MTLLVTEDCIRVVDDKTKVGQANILTSCLNRLNDVFIKCYEEFLDSMSTVYSFS